MSENHQSSKFILLSSIGGICVIMIIGFVSIKWIRTSPEDANNRDEGRVHKPISLIASGDTSGWIIPCGCTSNQSGGLLRRGSYVSEQKKHSEVILVDVGGTPGGVSPYDKVKFEAILKGEIKMGMTAHNLGKAELEMGADYLIKLSEKLKIPFITSNVLRSNGEVFLKTYLKHTVQGQRFLIVGLLSPHYIVEGFKITNPRDSILNIIDQEKNKYDRLIVLAYLPTDELRELSSNLPEADVILGGPTGQTILPEKIGPVLLSAATNKGKFLIHLNAPNSDKKTQWNGQVIELDSEIPDDSIQKTNLSYYYKELERQDFSASETGYVSSLPASYSNDYKIAGTDSCLDCHQNDCEEWKKTTHSHAWMTLQTKGSHVDSDCQRCHTTGFGMPGGFVSAKRSSDRVEVGCESCHGPSSSHVDNYKIKTPFLARDQCIRCHDRENSPDFAYDLYWKKILHGEKIKVNKEVNNTNENIQEKQL